MRLRPRFAATLALCLAMSCGGGTLGRTDQAPTDPVMAARLGSAPRVRFDPGDRPARGPQDALVTLVVFTDHECPFCARLAPTLETLRRRYRDSLREVVVLDPLPFHTRARPAATLALEALDQRGPDAFFAVHDHLAANREQLDDVDLLALAARLGLDVERVSRAITNSTHGRRIDADVDAARSIGVAGVPCVLVNGRPVVGAKPLSEFVEVIEDELRIARAAVADGVPRAQYAAAVLRGSEPGAIEGPARPAPRLRPGDRYAVPLAPREAVRGPDDALVTIVEYGDYECAFTRRLEPVLVRLLGDVPDDVRVVFRDHPLPHHRAGLDAAALALEVARRGGATRRLELHDALLAATPLDAEPLRDLGRRFGVDDATLGRVIDQDVRPATLTRGLEAGRRLGVEGTPTLFVNGRVVVGALGYDELRAVVDEELVRARALVASGVPRRQVYARTLAGLPTAAPTSARPATHD